MKYLLDTCVIAEVVKPKPNSLVIEWLSLQKSESLYLSVLTFGEIEKGIEKSVHQNKKNKLKLWLEEDLKHQFEGQILPIDMSIALKWGEIQGQSEKAGRPLPAIDGLIAVSAIVNNCIIVTRNVTDMAQSGVEILNPWNA